MTIILFDVDGVLIKGYGAQSTPETRWDRNLKEDFGISREDFKRYFIKEDFENEVLTGKIALHKALQKSLPEMGYDGDVQAFIDYWIKMDANVNEELVGYVEKLAELPDVYLFLATCQEHVRARYLMEEVGFNRCFDDIFYSARCGYLKPDPRYYEWVNKQLDFKPGDKVVMFDDRAENIEGAIKAGWEGHVFERSEDIFNSETVRSLLS